MSINVVLALMIIVSFLGALALHELSHALMASWLGDPTPRNEGRQSLSLRSHLDPVGLLLCVILAFRPLLLGPVGLGWGKPVKVDPWKLRGGSNTGNLLVALTGILSSLLIGALIALVLRFLPLNLFANVFLIRIIQLLVVFASVNFSLAIFNILPFYPLDMYQIVYALLPPAKAVQFAKSATYGPFIILTLFFLLPFIAQFSGLADFPLFRIPFYILLGSLSLIELITGIPNFSTTLYFL